MGALGVTGLDVRVLEIEGAVAGGYAAKLLADHGAEVTRVTGLGRGPLDWTDGMRLYLDRAAAMVDAPDRTALAGLLAEVDIVIQSSAPDPLASVIADLPADPGRIEVEISPFGSGGPWRGWRSTDLTDQAVSGHLYLNGDPDREPLRGPEHQVSYAAGTHAAIGALAALLAREVTGRGQRVEVSHHQVMTALHQFTLLRHTHNGDTLTRMGNRYAGPGHPVGVYACGTGLITLITPRGDQLESLLAVTGLEHLLDHPDVDGIYGLMHHPTLVDEHLGPWLAANDLGETVELFQALRIPAAAVSTMDDVLGDAHLAERGAWEHHPFGGASVRIPGPVARISPLAPGGPPEGQATERGSDPARIRSDGPLAGLRVIDLTRVWAGPYGTRILADLGADVIMVEAPWARGGPTIDDVSVLATRYYPDNEPGERHWNRIGFANKYNINKRSIALDLRTTAGVEILESLIAGADVLVENYSPRVMPNFGLDEARLHELNPSLVYVTMPGFGRSGPSMHHVAYGPIIDSQAGLSVLMGYEGETARKAGVAWPDPVAGMHAALATIAAVRQRSADDLGRTVEVAQIDATVAMVGHALADAQLAGPSKPIGNRDRVLAPQGVYPCAGTDRWLALSVIDDEGWAGLCRLAGLPEDLRSLGVGGRRREHGRIDAALAAWTSTGDQDRLAASLQAVGVAAAPVADAAGVLADPQLAAQDFFVWLDHPEAGGHRWPRLPIGLSDTPATYRRPGPLLNEHGVEILTDLVGLDDGAVSGLLAAGVVTDRPPD